MDPLLPSLRTVRKLGILGSLFRTLGNAGGKERFDDEGGWNVPRFVMSA